MARQEHSREDLMAEATGLLPRLELRLPGEPDPVVVGWKSNGWFSVYFGESPVYHFDGSGGLRRAFRDDRLYRLEARGLCELERQRSEGASVLVRHPLSAEQQAEFLAELRHRLTGLAAALESGAVTVLREVSDTCHAADQLLAAVQLAARGQLSSDWKPPRRG
ncbi:MAG: hypothetical protein ACKOGA_06385 [Planctomycetaceae bacterium]